MIQTWIIDQKPRIWANLGPIYPNFSQINFFENQASSLFLTYLRLTWCKKSKKSYDKFPRKAGNERTNGRTNGRTNERTNGGESIGPTSEVGGSKNQLTVVFGQGIHVRLEFLHFIATSNLFRVWYFQQIRCPWCNERRERGVQCLQTWVEAIVFLRVLPSSKCEKLQNLSSKSTTEQHLVSLVEWGDDVHHQWCVPIPPTNNW